MPQIEETQANIKPINFVCLRLIYMMFPSFPEVFLIPVLSPVALRLAPVPQCALAVTILWIVEEKVSRRFQPTCLKV